MNLARSISWGMCADLCAQNDRNSDSVIGCTNLRIHGYLFRKESVLDNLQWLTRESLECHFLTLQDLTFYYTSISSACCLKSSLWRPTTPFASAQLDRYFSCNLLLSILDMNLVTFKALSRVYDSLKPEIEGYYSRYHWIPCVSVSSFPSLTLHDPSSFLKPHCWCDKTDLSYITSRSKDSEPRICPLFLPPHLILSLCRNLTGMYLFQSKSKQCNDRLVIFDVA